MNVAATLDISPWRQIEVALGPLADRDCDRGRA